jgi:hypothetical protein
VLANVLRLIQIARTFEEGGGLSFRGFVDHLDALSDASDKSEQPMIEDGVEGVRLMTVHKAKGLEFPVVILCDITCPLSTGASRHVDPDRKMWAMRLAGGSPWELLDHEDSEAERDRAESLRLLYVAATRARDVLVVPAVADEPQRKGWVGPLLPGLYPPEDSRFLSVIAAGCPRFPGSDTVIDRPPRAPVATPIRPGLHKPERGRHEVVWWDPSLFENPHHRAADHTGGPDHGDLKPCRQRVHPPQTFIAILADAPTRRPAPRDRGHGESRSTTPA